MFIKKIISEFIYKLNMEVLLITTATAGRGKLMVHIQWGSATRRRINVVFVA